jgi:hypothetical protein
LILASSIDQFFRALGPRLEEDIANRMASLAGGSATQIVGSPISTAERYAAEVSYIKALNDVLRVCHEIEVEMYGGKKPDEENQG